ncbi:GNAT family N-acetyltransferase [Patescibacteria group bacterium]
MQIRSATKSDMKDVEKIFKLPELSTATGEYLSAETLSKYMDEKYFLVAEDEGNIIGAMFGERLKNDGAMLWEFAVEESARGKGIGSALLDVFEKNMISESRRWVILYAPVKNPKTINFYEKHKYSKGKLHVEFLKYLNK